MTNLTYQTLYRKYRSQTFSDLVGQDAIARALQGAIASGRVAHAYLFSGSRGTGKTSTARLLAKAVNCLERADGESEPCNHCESCLQVARGAALDVIEIDAASNNGIDEVRDLRDHARLAPALGRRKIYIIDEAHMLSGPAFNALLKTLEEPPPHVAFVLCTTELQKVPLTVLGRCQQFVFRRFADETIVARLAHVARAEGVDVEPPALELMARVAQGSMRDALGVLDQLIPLTAGRVTVDSARELLGIADPAEVEALVDCVLTGRAAEALARLAAIYEGGGELRQVVRAAMERCRDLLVAAIERRDGPARERLSRILEGLLHLDGEVRRHAEPRFLVEATLVRLAVEGSPVPGVAVPPPAAVQSVPVATPEPAAAPVAAAETIPASPSPASPQPRPAPAAATPQAAPPPPQPPAPAAAPPASPPLPGPAAADPAADELRAGWQRAVEQLNPLVKAYFRDARPAREGQRLVLSYGIRTVHERAQTYEHAIRPLVDAWLGPGLTIEFRLLDAPAPSARAAEERPVPPEEHPVVLDAVRRLEGRVTKVSVPKEGRS